MDTGEYAQVSISNCTFDSNSAQRHGGAISSLFSLLHLYASIMHNNSAENGGAAYLMGVDANIAGIYADANTALLGGAMYAESGQLEFFSIYGNATFSCDFYNNSAQEGGVMCINFILFIYLF